MIFYFSGTGNSGYTAERIAQATDEKLISIPATLRGVNYVHSLKDREMIGFVFPTYFYGIPTVVADLLELLQLKGYDPQKNYTFMVCTYGKANGSLRYDFGRMLQRQGIIMHAAYDVLFPDNYILLLNLLPPEEKIPEILAKAEKQIDEVIVAIRERHNVQPSWSLMRWLQTATCYPLYKYGRSTNPFHISESCIHCGLCVKNCPSGMIHMLGGRPIWDKGKCTQCLACIHRCPVHAIEYGKTTQGRGRYINPHLK